MAKKDEIEEIGGEIEEPVKVTERITKQYVQKPEEKVDFQQLCSNPSIVKVIERKSPKRYRGKQVSGVLETTETLDFSKVEDYVRDKYGGGDFILRFRDASTGKNLLAMFPFSLPGKPKLTPIIEEEEEEEKEEESPILDWRKKAEELKYKKEYMELQKQIDELETKSSRVSSLDYYNPEAVQLRNELKQAQEKLNQLTKQMEEERMQKLQEKIDLLEKKLTEEKKSEVEFRLPPAPVVQTKEKEATFDKLFSNPAVITGITSAITSIIQSATKSREMMMQEFKELINAMREEARLQRESDREFQRTQFQVLMEKLAGNEGSSNLVRQVRDVMELAFTINKRMAGLPVDDEKPTIVKAIEAGAQFISQMNEKAKLEAEEKKRLQERTQNEIVDKASEILVKRLEGLMQSKTKQEQIQAPKQVTNLVTQTEKKEEVSKEVSKEVSIEEKIEMARKKVINEVLEQLIVDIVNKPGRPEFVDLVLEKMPDDILKILVSIKDIGDVVTKLVPVLNKYGDEKLINKLNELLKSPENINFLRFGLGILAEELTQEESSEEQEGQEGQEKQS